MWRPSPPLEAQVGYEWDEFFLAAPLDEVGDYVVYSCNSDADRYIWTLVRLTAGAFRPLVGLGDQRTAPGIRESDVNWVCDIQDANDVWAPSASEIASVMREGQEVAHLVMGDANLNKQT